MAKVDARLHKKMKDIVESKGKVATLIDEYNLAIRKYIQEYSEEEILKDSKIEDIISTEIKKVDKHLASMIGRTGMDTSMVLVGMIMLLQKTFGVEYDKVVEKLRIDGARYYTNTSKKEKGKDI